MSRLQSSAVYYTWRKTKHSNKSEAASSISEEDDEDTSNSEAGDVDDVIDVCAIDNPNSITCKLDTILSKLEECPRADDKVDTTDINRRLDKLENITETIRNVEKVI